MLLVQVPPPPGVDPLFGWLFGVLMTTLTTAIGFLWRQSVAESKRKDALIDRLLDQIGKTASATDRTVTLAERRANREERGR